MTSLSQQKKIDELEAQLQEAEDIVKDLREELREVHSELERVRNSEEKLLDDRHSAAGRGILKEDEVHYSPSIAVPSSQSEFGYVAAADSKDRHQFQKYESSKFYSGIPYMGNLYPDLPSIILRSKEPELYRNGCTQRIRASEGNILNRTLSGKIHERKDEISAQEDMDGKEIVSVPNPSIRNTVEKKVLEADSRLGGWHPVPFFGVKKKRATRFRKMMITSSRSFPDQLPRINQAPDLSCAETHLISVRSDVHLEENELNIASRLSSDEAEPGLKAGCAEVSEYDIELVNSSSVHNPVNANEITEKSVLITGDSAGTSVVTVGETDIQKDNILLPISEPNESSVVKGICNQPMRERIIKYTFQRKRKKECFGESNGVISLESDSSRRRTLEKQRNPVEQEMPNLVTESSRDSPQLAQVAHQVGFMAASFQYVSYL